MILHTWLRLSPKYVQDSEYLIGKRNVLHMYTFVYAISVSAAQQHIYQECKISPMGVTFRPMKRDRKQLREIRQSIFGNVIDCRWQPSGGLFGPQWFFVMARPAIIQQD